MFSCIQCGDCCSPHRSRWGIAKTGTLVKACVLFTDGDVARAAAFLGLDADEFKKKYGVDKSHFIDVTHSSCPFLNDENRCSIHDAKPDLCKNWPKNGATQEQLKDCPGYEDEETGQE